MKKLLFPFMLLVIATTSILSVNYLFSALDDARHVSYYANYRSIQSTQSEFEIYKDLSFISNSVFHKEVEVVWQDVLHCDLYDNLGFRYYSFYESKAIVEPKDGEGAWVWQGEKPEQEAECYLDATIRITTDRDNTKFIHIKSNNFKIIGQK